MKISQVLIDSQKTRTQITGSLVKDWNTEGVPKNYCALGALACEKGMINNINDIDLPFEVILNEYGIKNAFVHVKMPREGFFNKGMGGKILSLTSCIWHLNDHYEWSFKKIGKYIKKLEDEGIIQYNENNR